MPDKTLPDDPSPDVESNGHGEQPDRLFEVVTEFVNTDDWAAARDVLNRHPLLLSEQAFALLEQSIHGYLEEENLPLAYHLMMHRDLLRVARDAGYDAAFELVARPPSEALMQAIGAFVNAADWHASRAVLEQHAELLSHEANLAFQGVIQAALAADDRQRLEGLISHHEVLRAAQEEGIDAAFASLDPSAQAEPDLKLLSVIGHNTIAVMLGEPENRADWLASVRQLREDALSEGDESLAALLGAVVRLLEGEPVDEIEPEGLGTAHTAVWAQIQTALG